MLSKLLMNLVRKNARKIALEVIDQLWPMIKGRVLALVDELFPDEGGEE